MALRFFKSFFLLLIFMPLFSNQSAAQSSWIYVSSTFDNEKWYIRNEFVTKENNSIKIWIKIKSSLRTIKKKVYKNIEEKQLVTIDCFNKKYSIANVTVYSSAGNVLDSFTPSYQEFTDVIPDSIMETVLQKVCKLFDR